MKTINQALKDAQLNLGDAHLVDELKELLRQRIAAIKDTHDPRTNRPRPNPAR